MIREAAINLPFLRSKRRRAATAAAGADTVDELERRLRSTTARTQRVKELAAAKAIILIRPRPAGS